MGAEFCQEYRILREHHAQLGPRSALGVVGGDSLLCDQGSGEVDRLVLGTKSLEIAQFADDPVSFLASGCHRRDSAHHRKAFREIFPASSAQCYRWSMGVF